MENEQKTMNITSHEVQEALEQIRAGFTVSRIALGAATLLYTLNRKGEKWAKKFTKIQNDYHKFLLDTYTEMEAKFHEMEEAEKKEYNSKVTSYNIDDKEVADAVAGNPSAYKG